MRPADPLREERRFEEFASFLQELVKELNDLSEEGAAVLVEGKRDVAALRGLGYTGPLFTVSILTSTAAAREKLRREVSTMVILTDLDTEGRRLASRYIKFLSHEGVVRIPGPEEAALQGLAGGLPAHREPPEVQARRSAVARLEMSLNKGQLASVQVKLN